MKRLKALSDRAEKENDVTVLLTAQEIMEQHHH